MSLVTGLLTHNCSILRPQFDVNENITGYVSVGSNVPVLVTKKTTSISTESGGRQSITQLVAIFEILNQSQVNVNDVITNVVNNSTGKIVQDSANGGALKNVAFKVTGWDDPNFLGDHLELPVENFHGRIEGQP